MPEPVLSVRSLNRAVLARQGLLARAERGLAEALERMGGLQAQYAPSMYIGLWSRLAGLERATLTAALCDRSLVQGTLLRSTIHLVSRADYWPFAHATRAARRRQWLRATDATPQAMAAAARAVRRALGERTLSRAELEGLVGKPRANAVGAWIDLVRVPPAGTWERRRADVFGAADVWLGDEPALDERAAAEHLVRRYLAAFGPASRKDVATFTGLAPAVVRPLLARLELRTFRSESGERLLDLRDQPLPDPETPAPPRFLPTWDAALLVHARRALILPEEHRPKLFHVRLPQSLPSFLIDGQVAGTWRFQDGEVALAPFAPLPDAAMAELEAEAARLASFHR